MSLRGNEAIGWERWRAAILHSANYSFIKKSY